MLSNSLLISNTYALILCLQAVTRIQAVKTIQPVKRIQASSNNTYSLQRAVESKKQNKMFIDIRYIRDKNTYGINFTIT